RVFPDAPLGWVFPGDPGIPNTLAKPQYDRFAPRLGIAYSPEFSGGILGTIFGGPGKTSIRAAYGLYYTAVEDLTLFGEIGDAPFGLFYVSPTAVYLEEPYKDRISGNDPGQRFPYTFPGVGATGFWGKFLPIAVSPAYKVDNVMPYTEHYNFNIQRQIGSTTVLTLAYVGSQGHHLLANLPFNPGSPARCFEINAILAQSNPAATPCGPGFEDQIYDLGNGQFAYGTRPYSVTSGRYLSQGLLDFGDNAWTSTLANSSYNSLQVSLEKRVGALRFLGAYTWGKSLDNGSGYRDYLNPYDQRVDRALSTFNVAHNF
ncbi:MAG: TonB-dependent receptor, partial [Acidobacteria bacterium]